MIKHSTLIDHTRVILTDKGHHYQYYKLVGKVTEKPWRLVPESGKLEYFETEEDVVEYLKDK